MNIRMNQIEKNISHKIFILYTYLKHKDTLQNTMIIF